MDKLKQKAVQTLSGKSEQEPKPGELLAPDSGYPPKFIEEHNQFHSQYQQRHSENPEFWDHGAKWWAEVRKELDIYKGQSEEARKGTMIDKLLNE